uniref:C2H2-type domain-containing protein n=1 Tax=Gongylonema pulchrum TaxID=637853 RepID=A0A183EAQ6_9BILA
LQVFASQIALQGHSQVHSSRTYHCDFCPLSFASRSRFETHRKKHFTEKNFKCQICDAKFSRCSMNYCAVISDLKWNRIVHENEILPICFLLHLHSVQKTGLSGDTEMRPYLVLEHKSLWT